MNCQNIKQSLHALELFVSAQQQTAAQQMALVWKRRKLSFSSTEAETEVAYILQRDNDLLRSLQGAVAECGRKELKSMLESMAGMGHYFCPYCTDDKTLMRLRDRLYLDVTEALENLPPDSNGRG